MYTTNKNQDFNLFKFIVLPQVEREWEENLIIKLVDNYLHICWYISSANMKKARELSIDTNINFDFLNMENNTLYLSRKMISYCMLVQSFMESAELFQELL